jgi:hypothetical protein
LPGTRASDFRLYCRLSGFAYDNLEEAFAEACRTLDLALLEEPRRSDWLKAIGGLVRGPDGIPYWMKVTGICGPPATRLREGEESSAAIAGVPRPAIHKIHDWTAKSVHWRALLMAPGPSPTVGSSMSFGRDVRPVTDHWLECLKSALDGLGQVVTSRLRFPREHIVRRLTRRFGAHAPYAADEWRAAHGDVNWGHVTAPDFCLLDWEMWGLAPRGFDAATLIVRSSGNPELVERLRVVFAEDLDTPSGRVAQLLSCDEMLSFIEAGWVAPRFYRPVADLARQVLRSV